MTLKSTLGVTQHGNLCTICTLMKSADPDCLFAAKSAGLSSFNFTQQVLEGNDIS